MKKSKVLASLVLVALLVSRCAQAVPTEITTQTPTEAPIRLGEEYDDFLETFDFYFGLLMLPENSPDYEIYQRSFFKDDDGDLWLGISIKGANNDTDDAVILGIVAGILSTEIKEGYAEFPEKPIAVLLVILQDDSDIITGASIIWEGLELYADDRISTDKFIEDYVDYQVE